jgi:hypothetical protein
MQVVIVIQNPEGQISDEIQKLARTLFIARTMTTQTEMPLS